MRSLLFVVAFMVSAIPAPGQPEQAIYETVLRHLRSTRSQAVVVLGSSVTNIECPSWQCTGPRVIGALPERWLREVHVNGLINDFCTVRSEDQLCIRSGGEPVDLAKALWVTLSSIRGCGEGCAEVLAFTTGASGAHASTTTLRYSLHKCGEKWMVVEQTVVGTGSIDVAPESSGSAGMQ